MTTLLLDGNVLVALVSPTHVHHEAAHRWWSENQASDFATCPVTQGTLLRTAIREGVSAKAALQLLRRLTQHPRHVFWPDDLDYLAADLSRVLGHRQVTDAYLASLARRHGGALATFDAGLVAVHPDVAVPVPTR